MTALWREDEHGWTLISPAGFPTEEALHDVIERSPELLPLQGSPGLIVLGREVRCGSGLADLVAVEPTGRLSLVEIKLKGNAESRRAVVGQLLAYAAFLHGLSPTDLEEGVLRGHLPAGVTIASRVGAADQDGTFDAESFTARLAEHLEAGRFRLVFVLDEAPPDLVRVVGYLEAVTDGLLIDLVTIASYEVGDSKIVVPQKVEPERVSGPASAWVSRPSSQTYAIPVPGCEEFQSSIDAAKPEDQPALQRLPDWARALEAEGLAELWTTTGKVRWALVPRIAGDRAGLLSIWNEGGASIILHRSVFERRGATTALAALEELCAPVPVGQGTKCPRTDDAVLEVLANAYREAQG